MKKQSAALLATLTFALSATPVFAQKVQETDDSVQMELGNDIYTAGNVIDITRNVPDDLVVAGNKIMVRGVVTGDVLSAGSNVTINGEVRDDIRIAAGDVTINGRVGGDVIAFGGTIYIAKGASISGSVLIAGGNVVIEAPINGNLKIDADSVIVNGDVTGTADIRATTATINARIGGDSVLAAKTLTIGSAMNVGGSLRYWRSEGQMNIAGKVNGSATFDPELQPMQPKMEEGQAEMIIGTVLAAISIFTVLFGALTIGLFMFATRTFFTESAKRLQKAPGWSLLIGLLYFLATPGVILLLMVTVIGIPLALALLAMYMITIFFAKIIAAMVLARWMELRTKKRKWHPVGVFFASLGIYLLLKLLVLIPFVGWIVCFFIVVTAYGAFATVKYERLQKIL